MTNMQNNLCNWVKDFDGWNFAKKSLDTHHDALHFSERDIWFVSVGTNIGFEIDGKNNHYERPVLFLKKFSDLCFFGLPLTSKKKKGDWYYSLRNERLGSTIVLNQGRLFSAKRLVRRVKYHVATSEFEIIKQRFKDLI